ncbi:MAG: hypothetical protein K9M75_04135 [Phycisphaerae bacterium]|nr:hypothetical protein [Phycisphaerae bacterium]
MAKSKLIVLLVVCALLGNFSFGMYDAKTGRFMQRDPIGTAPRIVHTEQGPKIIQSVATPTSQNRNDTVVIPSNRIPISKNSHEPLELQLLDLENQTQYADGMNLYQYVMSNPLSYLDPLGLESRRYECKCGKGIRPPNNYEKVRDLMGGCAYALPTGKIGDKLGDATSNISNNLLSCLFWQESSMGQNPNYMKGSYIGLGQMGESACKDVDRIYKLPPGTCWRRQQSGSFCDQIANTRAYLSIIYAFYKKGSIRDSLRRYGPPDAPHAEYADPLLNCEKCMNKAAGKEGIVPWCNAEDCFKNLNKEVQDARRKRL